MRHARREKGKKSASLKIFKTSLRSVVGTVVRWINEKSWEYTYKSETNPKREMNVHATENTIHIILGFIQV